MTDTSAAPVPAHQRESSLPTAGRFDLLARLAFSATCLVGVLVATASEIPSAVRSLLLLAGLGGWLGAVVLAAAAAARSAWRRPAARAELGATLLGVFGIAIAVLGATQLALIRSLWGRPALVWNIDWRWSLSHAQAIARFGGLDQALDFSGLALNYHVGPAWLAGAAGRVLGSGMAEILFGLVPFASVLSIALAGISILHAAALPYRLAAGATGIGMTLPSWSTPLQAARRAHSFILYGAGDVEADFWPFSSGLMLNSYLGLAVGLSSLALLLDRRSRIVRIALGTVGLASLIKIKPQFFAGFGLLAGLMGILRLAGRGAFAPRSSRLLAASLISLVLALAHFWGTSPGAGMYGFGAPTWSPGATGYSFDEPFRVSTFLLIGGLAAWRAVPRRDGGMKGSLPQLELLVGAAVAVAILTALLCSVSFPAKPELLDEARELGLRGYRATMWQQDLAQSLNPALRLVLTWSALGILLVWAAAAKRRWISASLACGSAVVLSPLLFISVGFADPLKGYEAAEDMELRNALLQIPVDGTLLIASDLADPAEDYARPQRATLMTAYGGHIFYVTNLSYVQGTDAVERLSNLRAFFGAAWSDWHSAWIQTTGITHLLINDRCVPAWAGDLGLPLRASVKGVRWTVFETQGLERPPRPAQRPAWQDISARYGRAECILPYWRAEERQH